MNKRAIQKSTYGFVKSERDNVFKMESKKMPAVRLMFDLCLDGMSLGQIKEVIEAQGIIVYNRLTKVRFGRRFLFLEQLPANR